MDHPITPPPELVQQWHESWYDLKVKHIGCDDHIATQAARWGADQELEACCGLIGSAYVRDQVRTARRPRPPSLAEEALEQLKGIRSVFKAAYGGDLVDEPIRRALERLQELEQQENNDN